MRVRLLLLSSILLLVPISSEAQARVLLLMRSCPIFSNQATEINMMLEDLEAGKLKTESQLRQWKLDSLTDSSVSYQTSGMSDWSMFILPQPSKEREILVTIETVREPRTDSSIAFYSSLWEALPTNEFFSLPSANDFIPRGADPVSPEVQRLRNLLSPLYLSYRCDAKGQLEVRAMLSLSLEDQTNKTLKALIAQMPTLKYRWENGKFLH